MEGNKQEGSSLSSSSFTSDLFGSKDSYDPSSSSGLFATIFSPSSKVLGRGSLQHVMTGNKDDSVNETWNDKDGPKGTPERSTKDGNQRPPDGIGSSFYQEGRLQHPCHLSSSIYYGGQDVFCGPQNHQSSGFMYHFKKDGEEDDTGSASRGNWWQGSLYY